MRIFYFINEYYRFYIGFLFIFWFFILILTLSLIKDPPINGSYDAPPPPQRTS